MTSTDGRDGGGGIWKDFFLLNDIFSLKNFPLDQRNNDANHPVMGINDMRVSAITWAKTLMMLRETNRFVYWRRKKTECNSWREKDSVMFFFLAISFALFSLSTACLFGETSFLIPPLNMPLLYFEGGRGRT